MLTDVHAQSLGFMGRKLVRNFVAAGGGLFVAGGFHSFGRGGLERTLLEEVLPVRVVRTFDLVRMPASSVVETGRCVAVSGRGRLDAVAPVLLASPRGSEGSSQSAHPGEWGSVSGHR